MPQLLWNADGMGSSRSRVDFLRHRGSGGLLVTGRGRGAQLTNYVTARSTRREFEVYVARLRPFYVFCAYALFEVL